MKKKFALTLGAIVLLVIVLAGGKALQINALIAAGASMQPPPEVVSTALAKRVNWESLLTSVGSAEAANGVTITAEVPGRVAKILFTAGGKVKAGDVLLEQDIESEKAQLRVATTSVDLATKNLARIRDLWEQKLVSQAQYDNALAEHESAIAQMDNLRTNIEKRIIRAPFDGRLGIRQVNLGQDINQGQAIVSLQAADLMFINFFLPQKHLSKLRSGLIVRARSDAAAGKIFEGVLTTISPEIDPVTRSVRLQATFTNADNKLIPGMFARVEVILDAKQEVLVVPVTAVSYATFGDSIFVIESAFESGGKEAQQDTSLGDMKQDDTALNNKSDASAAGLVARQQFILLGKTRGDFVIIEKGLNEGDVIAVTGVFKLQNGASVVVDNKNVPDFHVNPQPKDT